MNDKYFFTIDASLGFGKSAILNQRLLYKVQYRKRTLIDAIGNEKYLRWKRIEKLFRITDAMSACDFLVYLYSDSRRLYRNPSFTRLLIDRFGINDIFIATKYCILRGIDFNIKAGEYHAFMAIGYDPKNIVCGHGPTLIMAIGNLHFELNACLEPSFIP